MHRLKSATASLKKGRANETISLFQPISAIKNVPGINNNNKLLWLK